MRVWLGVLASVVVLPLVGTGCRTSEPQETTGPKPRVFRAGQPFESPELELTEADERLVEAHARFAAGWLAEMEDSPILAIEHFRMAAELDPENERLTLDAARRLADAGQLDAARKLLERATSRTNASGMLWGSLGLVHTLQRNSAAAIAANEEAIRRMPGNLGAYQMLARVYLGAGQHAEALRVLDEAAAKQPATDPLFQLGLAETLGVLMRVRQPPDLDLRPRIRALLDRAGETRPEDPLVRLRLAEMYQQIGADDRSLPLYTGLLESHPDLPGLRPRLLGIYLRSENFDKAAEHLTVLSTERPTNPLLHYCLGILALESKKSDDAVAAFDKVLLLRPEQEDVYLDIAGALLSHRLPNEGLRVLEKARTRFQPTFQLELFTALAQLETKRYEDAVRAFTAAEVIGGAFGDDALDHVFYFQSGVAYERLGKIEDAAIQFEKSLEKKPDFPDALNYLGYMWAEKGMHLEKAKELIERAVKLQPDNEAYLDSLAWVLHQMGRSEEALPHQLKAIAKAEQPDATLFDHLGDIYQRLGKNQEAREAWKRAQEIEAKPEVQRKLDTAVN